jgi:hypothetical protein
MRKFFLLALLLVSLFSSARADDVFLGNKPFKGQVYGVGSDIRVSLQDLAGALGVTAEQTSQGWQLAGKPVKVVEDHGAVWIGLDDIPPELVRVVRNKEFGTIDMFKVAGGQSTSAPVKGSWGGDGVLVFFGASWDPHTAEMRNTISQLEQSRVVDVAYVDVENMETPAYKEYAYLFEGNKVPYFVLLDGEGRKLHSFTGFQTYSEMLAILKKHLKPG